MYYSDAENLLILYITNTEYNYCFIMHWKSQIKYKTVMLSNEGHSTSERLKPCANGVVYLGFVVFLSLR